MQLVGFNKSRGNFSVFRKLEENEIADHHNHTGELDVKTEGDTHKWHLHLSAVPNDVFAEIGLAVTLGKK